MKRSHAETAEYEDNVQPEQAPVEEKKMLCVEFLFYFNLSEVGFFESSTLTIQATRGCSVLEYSRVYSSSFKMTESLLLV